MCDNILCFFEEFFEEILGVVDVTSNKSSCCRKFTWLFVSLPNGIPKSFRFILAEEIVHFTELHVLILADWKDDPKVKISGNDQFSIVIRFDQFLNYKVWEECNISLIQHIFVDFQNILACLFVLLLLIHNFSYFRCTLLNIGHCCCWIELLLLHRWRCQVSSQGISRRLTLQMRWILLFFIWSISMIFSWVLVRVSKVSSDKILLDILVIDHSATF